ncbi:MAG: class I SAM-dependent methyltransferase [Acidobacteria bacterium]|nr:class I SAM-dependent methyltransferase [Acidobacteriota bacterium]
MLIDTPIETDIVEAAIHGRSRALIESTRDLGSTNWASLARACCVPFIFDEMERVLASNEEPIAGISDIFDRLISFLKSAKVNGIDRLGVISRQWETRREDNHFTIENVTGKHYGRLFRDFSESAFWDEPVTLLRTRLERNAIDLSRLSEHDVLDAGCGGGRYTVAWRLLGAKRVDGIDISSIGIANARQRVDDAGLDGVGFRVGSVLDLPYSDNSFDLAFSNGVLHHTVDWEKGVAELVRVLKPGGMGWLYLIENPGGVFWSVIDVLRELMYGENREFARSSLRMLGIPDNRIFYMLDHVLVPINLRLTPAEIEKCLETVGASQWRRLTRGADYDRIERIYQKDPYAQVKYGVGENRYVFSKG